MRPLKFFHSPEKKDRMPNTHDIETGEYTLKKLEKSIFFKGLLSSVSLNECQHVISDQRVYKSYTQLVPPTERKGSSK